ncbi:hypothetical protein [Pseudomonas sp.]|uniref:hypothetical protein n=1 Tax=unclassified Pseudomonas TaxID=196821 RepID=UPI002910C06C|nr:hypothetical protein [Pseudomonas sp.]MDU4250843.1 hypothetical protein [Pseudomonas sp.]
MSRVLHHKVVAALPSTLEPDSIYLVRVGSGYDQFVTNHSGQIVAYPMNTRTPTAVPAFLASGVQLRLPITPSGDLINYRANGSMLAIKVIFNG